VSSSHIPLRPLEPVLSLFVLLIVLLIPVIAQIGLTIWFLRRRIAQSAGSGPASWVALQLRAFLFSSAVAVLGFTSLWVLLLTTKYSGHPLGYVGFFLIAVVAVYAGIAFLSGFILATLLWYGQRNFEAGS
jgi:hypothetical protein